MTFLKSPSQTKCLRWVLLVFGLSGFVISAPRQAAAFGGVQQTRYVGVIQAVDYNNKTITFQPGSTGKSLSLGWNFETSFLADNHRVKADALKAGMKVKVKYHSPLFGREYASKIEWESVQAHPSH